MKKTFFSYKVRCSASQIKKEVFPKLNVSWPVLKGGLNLIKFNFLAPSSKFSFRGKVQASDSHIF